MIERLFSTVLPSSTTTGDLISVFNVAVVALLFVVVFRKQWSCNRSYHIDEDISADKNDDDEVHTTKESFLSSMTEEDEQVAEDLLDGAGTMLGNVQPLISALKNTTGTLAATAHQIYISEEDEQIAEDLLDGAGMLGNLNPLISVLTNTSSRSHLPNLHQHNRQNQCNSSTVSSKLLTMPHEKQVLICEFLHPRDVVSLASSCKTMRRTIDNSPAIWKALWHRDYSWIVTDWQPGIEAMRRSDSIINTRMDNSQKKFIFTKDFYFRFGLCWPNYVLAGNNTRERGVLVALHNCVFDITKFLDTHPGSPDTLMVHAGCDATMFFEDMSHSMGARKIALNMCVVANKANDIDGIGLAPTQHTELVDERQSNTRSGCASYHNNTRVKPVVDGGNILLLGRRQNNKQNAAMKTLVGIRTRFFSELQQARLRAQARYSSDPQVLGEANVYFDPFIGKWKVWYTSRELCTVFPHEL